MGYCFLKEKQFKNYVEVFHEKLSWQGRWRPKLFEKLYLVHKYFLI